MFGFSAFSQRAIADIGAVATNPKWFPVDDAQPPYYILEYTYLAMWVTSQNQLEFDSGDPVFSKVYPGLQITISLYGTEIVSLLDNMFVLTDPYYSLSGYYVIDVSSFIPAQYVNYDYVDVNFYIKSTTPIWTPIAAQG